jgi:hypothetical protein
MSKKLACMEALLCLDSHGAMGALSSTKQGVSLLRCRKEAAMFPNSLLPVLAHLRLSSLKLSLFISESIGKLSVSLLVVMEKTGPDLSSTSPLQG